MAEVLGDFLWQAARRRFDWATCNCFTIVADWVLAVSGRDPAAQWRGVASKAQARRVVRQAGGDVALVRGAMRAFGAVEIARPQSGDVALVRAPVGRRTDGQLRHRAVGAICVDDKNFAVLTVDLGLLIAPLPLIRAWRIDRG